MAGRGRPGSAPQTDKREAYARLIAAGVSSLQACRMVGINPRTGKRWRHGRTITSSGGRRLHYPPVINSPVREVSPRFLSEDERVAIADLHRRGRGARAIAREVGRDPATISRELRRNLDPASGQYRPFAAQRMAAARRARPGRGKLACDAELAGFVQEQLRRRWSPEQICHALRERFPDQPSRHLVPETIYQALYRPGSTLRRELPPRVLRTGRSRRRPRRHPNARRGRLVNMTMIDKRPAEAAERSTPGHWEGDLITGASNRSAIGTLVERTSRFTILLHLPADHGAQAVHQAVVAALAVLPASLRRSLTWDQGSEMALHAQISQELGMPVFFCEKASPWQRPSNENTNGLLRQYFPKGTDLRVHSLEQLVAVAAELNARPRKTLGWATPAQRLANLEATAT
jgi:transposase, IS30 family